MTPQQILKLVNLKNTLIANKIAKQNTCLKPTKILSSAVTLSAHLQNSPNTSFQ